MLCHARRAGDQHPFGGVVQQRLRGVLRLLPAAQRAAAQLLQFETVRRQAVGQPQERRAIAVDDALIHVDPFAVIAHHRIDIDLYLRIEGAHPLQPVGQNMALHHVAQIPDDHRPGAFHHAAGDQIVEKAAEPLAGDDATVRFAVIGRAAEQHAGHLQRFQPLFSRAR